METGNRIESFKGSFHHFSWKVFLTESQKNIGNTTYHITDIPAALVHENSNGKRRESGTPLHFPWCYTFFNQSYNGLMHWHKSYESHLPLYILSSNSVIPLHLKPPAYIRPVRHLPVVWPGLHGHPPLVEIFVDGPLHAVATNHWDLRTLWKQQVGRFLFHKIRHFLLEMFVKVQFSNINSTIAEWQDNDMPSFEAKEKHEMIVVSHS